MPARADKYDPILEAALALFVERGFHGTSVPDVARRAGVAAGTIYYYFDSKERMVNALFRHWKERVAAAVHTAFPIDAPPREQFRAIWHEMARFAREHPEAFAFLEFHHHASYLDVESKRLDQGLKQFGAGFVQAAQAAGVLKPGPPMLLMELVFGAFNGLVRAGQDGRIELDDAAFDVAEAACWDAVARHPG
ncbi:MAG TPA: TetR/AcrR family transcriptional regulator [Kofleriaceae bacterium]|nr:TetR/AcrR family transcriptional regulator [Kofleriaceae bacterium]